MPDPTISLLVAGVLAAIGLVLFWPQRGILPRWQRTRQLTERVLNEDALKHIHHWESKGQHPTTQSLAGALSININQAAEILAKLQAHNLLEVSGTELSLTPEGRDYALRIIRAHRLWERFLADKTGFSASEWHDLAERYEHDLTDADADALSAQLGHPTHDPHGDPIPTASGEFVAHGGLPLTTMPVNKRARIVHIEDEPEAVYAQLEAEGLHLGMEVLITELTPQRIRLWADGDEHILAPIVAANLSVIPIPEQTEAEEPAGELLDSLKPGQKGRVLGISPKCRGLERRRLMDLGVLPGTIIKAEMRSAGGDPTAYLVRDTLIALRAVQAKLITITPLNAREPQ